MDPTLTSLCPRSFVPPVLSKVGTICSQIKEDIAPVWSAIPRLCLPRLCLGGGVEKDSPLQACEPYLDLACLNPCRHCLSQVVVTQRRRPFPHACNQSPYSSFLWSRLERADSSEGSTCCCRSSGATDGDNDGVAQAAISASLPVPLEVR